METLVSQNKKNQDVTTSIIVAEVFGREHKNVLRDIDNLHCSDEFRKLNFELLFIIRQLPNGGSRKDPYYEITKDGFSFLVMGYTGDKAAEFKEQFIHEFNKREAMLKSDDYILARSREIMEKRIIMLEYEMNTKNERLQLQEAVIKESAPKVEYHDKVLTSKSVYTTTVIAKELGMTAFDLNKTLSEKKIQYKQSGTWVLYAQYQDKGYTKTNTTTFLGHDGETRTSMLTVWTEAGRKFIHDVIRNETKQKSKSA